jgi:alpha-L-rhamnosidase
MIVSNWHLAGGQLWMNVTVPSGATATLLIPTSDAASVTVSGRPAAQAAGVKPAPAEGDRVAFLLTTGSYQFAAKYTAQ